MYVNMYHDFASVIYRCTIEVDKWYNYAHKVLLAYTLTTAARKDITARGSKQVFVNFHRVCVIKYEHVC